MGDVTTRTKRRPRKREGGPGPGGADGGRKRAGGAPGGDPLQDPLGDGAVQMLADPLEGGAGTAVQFDEKNGPLEAVDTVLGMTGGTPNAKAVTSFAAEIRKISLSLKKAGTDVLSPDDRDQLAAAATLLDWAKKTTDLGNGVTNWVEKAIDMRKRAKLSDPLQDTNRAGGASKALDDAKRVVDIARLFTQLASSKNMVAFQADIENKSAREAWATEVTNTFDTLGTILPDSIADTPMALPLRMFKGYLSAPKAYLAAFKAVLDRHIGKLDEAARLKYNPKLLSGDVVMWGGPLTMLYVRSSSCQPRGLDSFMGTTHRRLMTDKKINIWNASLDVGIKLLISEVETQISDPHKKYAWTEFLKNPDHWR